MATAHPDNADDRDDSRGLTRRQIRVLVAAGFVIGFLGVPVAAGFLSNSVSTDGEVALQSRSGPTVFLAGNTTANLSAPFPDDQTVRLRTADGNVTFSSGAPTTARITRTNITGTWTRVDNLSVAGTDLTINPEDKHHVVVEGDATHLSFREDIQIDDGTADLEYGGPSGETSVTVRGLPGDVTVVAIDQATGTKLDASRTSEAGVATFTMPNSDHTVELQSSDDPSDIAPYYTNESANVSNESWMSNRRNATLDNVTHYLTRLGTFVIGTGSSQGNVGPAGGWLVAILGFGVFLAAVIGTRVGPVGGATLGVAAAAGFAAANVAPLWLYGLALFVVGLLLAAVFTRVLR